MKRSIIIALLLSSVSAFACMGGGMCKDHQMGMMRDLGLNDEQKSKIRTIRQEARSEKFKLMDKMEELQDQTDTRIMAVLNTEQKAKFIELRQENVRACKGPKGCEGGTMRGEKNSCGK
ncbi:MAG: hypothetical protein JXK05_13385 [Campylobacterales bacterium]|nr:hypothetical protein [Campylobacterales bacterium]